MITIAIKVVQVTNKHTSAGIPKIPYPNSAQRPDRPRGNPERPNPNHGKGTDDLKHRKQTDASMRKIQRVQVIAAHKSEKKHARKVIEYEKLLGVEEPLHTLNLQAVEGPYLDALKERIHWIQRQNTI